MSLSYQPLQPVLVKDPRMILKNKRDYAVLKCGSQTTWKQWTTTSVSASSMQFSTPPPSGQIAVDRKCFFQCPIRLNFSGNAPMGQLLLNPFQDAPRAFPLSGSIDTLNITINNQSVSINMADVIHALMHFNTSHHLKEIDYSATPTMEDQSQNYSNLFGSNRSPLAFYGDTNDGSVQSRGSFPFTIVSNTNTSAIVDFVVTEAIYLSPFYWGCKNGSAFINVNTMDWNVTFLSNAGNRMWSHDAVSTGVATTITSCVASFNNFSPAFSYADNVPLMLINYITPQATDIIPYNMPITYSYFDIQRYPSDSANAVAPYTNVAMSSNNIQLNSIPRRIYLYARQRNADLYASPNNTDTYFAIENISVQFQNKNGLLASANKRQLYEMSVKNHLDLSWNQFSGEPVIATGSAFSSGTGSSGNNSYGGVGSIVCIEFATDIGLDDLDAPGKLGQYMLQINMNAKNISSNSITPTFYIVVVSEGTFTIQGLGKASTNIGVITSQDILNARANPFVNYNDVEEVNGGEGNFLSGLKQFGTELLDKVKGAIPFVKDVVGVAKEVAPLLGFGEDDMMDGEGEGEGVSFGGRRMHRSQLHHRIKRMRY
jgi:hypothetical protein